MTALHYACLYSRINTTATRTAAAAPTRYVEALLAKGADPNCRNEQGVTPLHIAASRRAEGVEIAGVLLRSGADPNAVSHAGRVPLTETLPALDPSPDHSRRFCLPAVAALVAGGARLDHPDAGPDLFLMRGLLKEVPMFTEEEEEQLVALIEQHDEESRVHLREVMNETRLLELNREHRMRQVVSKMLNLRVAGAFAAWKQFRVESAAERALRAAISHREGEELSAVPEDQSIHNGAVLPSESSYLPPPPPPHAVPSGHMKTLMEARRGRVVGLGRCFPGVVPCFARSCVARAAGGCFRLKGFPESIAVVLAARVTPQESKKDAAARMEQEEARSLPAFPLEWWLLWGCWRIRQKPGLAISLSFCYSLILSYSLLSLAGGGYG